ncbi:MAG: hypothetical protein HY519_00690 [Candidatus Aenigmarchaeota archaeon]|nr:hypothetical protein [Candidatus Aenigmarchaeota archaeon]
MPVGRRRKQAERSANLLMLGLLAASGLLAALIVLEDQVRPIGPLGSAHAHADFKVYVNGQEIDFGRPEYDYVNPLAHLHTNNPNGCCVIHIEAENVPLGLFFASLGVRLTDNCFSISGTAYCNDGRNTVRLYVNGRQSREFGNYVMQDLDHMLVTYGASDQAEISRQLASVASDACIFSGKCPGKGPANGDLDDIVAFAGGPRMARGTGFFIAPAK